MWQRPRLSVLAAITALIISLDVVFPPPLAKAKEVSRVVRDRNGAPMRVYPVSEGRWRLKADLNEIDPAFIEALLEYEDERFYSHLGVDATAMVRATLNFAKAGRVVSGGSTITMQTARLLEPKPRTLLAKLQQMVRAVQLERRLSKQEILELYLTLAPYGGNIEGVRSASWAYFGREPQALTPDQIALLIALPQSPEARRPDLKPANAVQARERVLKRLVSKGVIATDRAKEAMSAPAPPRRNFPALAWHASDKAVERAPADAVDIDTALDIKLQSSFERLAFQATEEMGPNTQIAIIAVDTETFGVRASVGSASRDRAGGWLDLTSRRRSPGSTLKPFIYAMAFDDGIAAPSTQIEDLPKRFESYQPENFDRTFRGDVTIAQALQHSLNVPAVHALDAVGSERFAATLSFAGATLDLPKKADDGPGLAIALGGVGMSVQDVAVLYAGLGNSGVTKGLNWLRKTEMAEQPVRHLMSAETASKILDILRDGPSPQGRMPALLTQSAPDIAFKTGTSYGFRDAWAAGVAGRLAIVVWVGRADGAPRPGATGRETALPILFDAYDLAAQLGNDSLRQGPLPPTPFTGDAPFSLTSFTESDVPPEILFPPDGAEIWQDKPDRTFTLAARGTQELAWYVNGHLLDQNALGEPVWKPIAEGFYRLSVVDSAGRASHTNVRVLRATD